MAVVRKIACSVEDIRSHGEHVYTIVLRPAVPAPRFKPGQFLHLALDAYQPGGFWPESRVFSIASSPQQRDRLEITFAVKGAFTARMERELAQGREVWVKLPYGEFVVDATRDAVLFAGGTGVTAFTAFLQSLGEQAAPRALLFYGARTPELFIYGPLAEACACAAPSLACTLVPETSEGRLDVAASWPDIEKLDSPVFYLSGPPQMLTALTAQLRERGVQPETDLHRCLGVGSAPFAVCAPRTSAPGGAGEASARRGRSSPMLGERAPWEALRGARILMTGGTGFVGAWMVATALEVDQQQGLGIEFVLLTRSRRVLTARLPWLVADRRVSLVIGDVNDCAWPAGPFTHVVAGAASADAAVNARDPEAAYRAIVEGTKRTLELAARHAAARVLMLSSGAVYGDSASRRPMSEDAPTAPGESRDSSYHVGKRVAEGASREAAASGLPVSIARLFAFLGPYLPLDRHFAVGNFVADALDGGPVVVRGDGTPVRSYLYGCDMALWLWTILLAGQAGQAYNVGSERPVTVGEIARIVAAAVRPDMTVDVRGRPGSSGAPGPTGGGGAWYVPSTAKARDELGLDEWTSLEQGVARMIAWYGARGDS